MVINKATELRPPALTTMEDINSHIEEQNEDGWELLTIDNLGGWYRFFWKKSVE